MIEITDRFIDWMLQSGLSETVAMMLIRISVILIMVVLAFLIDRICRKAIIPVIHKITLKTEFIWDNYILSDKVLNDFCMLLAPLVVYILVPLVLPDDSILEFLLKICRIYIIAVFMKLLCSVISSFYEMTSEHESLKNHSLKGLFVGKSPVVLLTGLGAGTAILMLVFQDTIRGFVAGIQLIANDMLRPGDWITMPKYGADGDVVEVTLTTVKVRNWDKTIITVPPYALVNDSFQNWRGMFDNGGRRIKRSVNIDMNTVRFCTKKEMEEYRKQPWMEGFETTGNEEVNLYIFRHYMEYYLRHHPKVNAEMIMTVRQLQPTAQGLPVELYFFSADTRWLKYEHLQAEVFDHVLATLHRFGLKAFQSPTGMDIMNSKR